MKITVEIKTVYGKHLVYPVCHNSQLFARIAGDTTLTAETISLIKKLGYAIEIKLQDFKI